MLQNEDVREQGSAARVIWTLAFDKNVRQKILENTEVISTLEKLCDSTNKSVQTNANGALWVIKGENEVSREASKYKLFSLSLCAGSTKLSHMF